MRKFRVCFMTIITTFLVFVFNVVSSAAGMEICYDGQTHWYTGSVYSLKVNGNRIESPMEPIIFNDHALVPVREIFEECGATVIYDGESQSVEIYYGKKYIRMYINNNVAYVNGQRTIIPDNVVPKLIYKPGDLTKTMVPVRFIAESAGMEVVFDGANGEILIWADKEIETKAPTPVYTPEPAVQKVTITDIKTIKQSDNSLKVTVKGDGSFAEKFSYFTLSGPERVVVDFSGIDYVGGDSAVNLNMDGIESIRTGVDENRTRIVIDVENLKSYNVQRNENDEVEISVTVEGDIPQTEPEVENEIMNNTSSDVENSNNSGTSNSGSEEKKKVIMLDAGHGGSDPGAIGVLNGKYINEKDLTLSITNKVKSILEGKGYAVSMTRTGDTLPTLSERPAQANEEGCALFVSIHINSAEAKSAYGTEVFWSEENNGDDYNITSEKFAENVLDGMLRYMKSYNRGVKMANWAVIRRSQMPAVLVEVGFISNEDELKKMCSDDYQNKTAQGIAEGIIETLNKVEIPEKETETEEEIEIENELEVE